MAARLLHSLADDNPDLQKQIGCMTGVFQLFDRHQIVPGRRITGHSPKRPPPGSPQFDNRIAPESESSHSYQRPYIAEKHSHKIIQDKNRALTESSRDSFSSMSRSSSFSSLDCTNNRATHPEHDQIVFPETPSRDTVTRQSCNSSQSIDFRDVVKDSMYKHNKPTAKEEASEHDFRESLDALAKFQEASFYYNEPRELSRSKSYQFRDGSSFSVPKDCPRFSYDGRETNRLSIQSRDNAKTVTSKQPDEIPRFSLDSRESSTRSLNSVSKTKKGDDVVSVDRGSIQSRPPGVVAKLMGLETLPDSVSVNKKDSAVGPIRTSQVEDIDPLSKSLKAPDFFGPIKMHSSSRSLLKEPTSPLWRNSEMKPISRFPIEPAPWKQNGVQSPQRLPVSRVMKSPNKIRSPYSSVYSEVDKRLKHLEFTQSGKDLRALKQILEAMQSMEARKEGTKAMVKRHSSPSQISDSRHNPRGSNSNILRAYESPIVIMKPAKLSERSGMHVEEFLTNNIPKSTRRENAVNLTEVKGGGRHTRITPPALPKKQQLTKENATGKSSGSISPRLQQKRLELEKRSRPPTPPVDSNKLRKQPIKQSSESSSSGGRRMSKYSNVRQNVDHYREVSSGSKKLSLRESQLSKEVVNVHELSEKIDNKQSPSSIHEKSALILIEDESLDPEYPSPVSVLDDGVYMDGSPSPVKHMLKTLKHVAIQGTKDEWESPNVVTPDTLSSNVSSEINRKKLQNIGHLVQKLTRLNSSHDEAHTDYIASLCENTKPDDRYISEIFLASGLLLRDLGSSLTAFQFHSSGHPINPELFLVLEQTKFSNLPKQNLETPEKTLKKQKFHRKLIFDTVNEILAGKLSLLTPFQKSSKLVNKTLNAQKLLRDLCFEIEQLQMKKKKEDVTLDDENDDVKSVLWEEILNGVESWTDFDCELPVIALEVERLIFKDLVNEVVLGEASDGRRIKPGRRCRQLFLK